MRRLFEITSVILLGTLSSIFALLAILFPAPGVRLVFKKLAIKFSEVAKNI